MNDHQATAEPNAEEIFAAGTQRLRSIADELSLLALTGARKLESLSCESVDGHSFLGHASAIRWAVAMLEQANKTIIALSHDLQIARNCKPDEYELVKSCERAAQSNVRLLREQITDIERQLGIKPLCTTKTIGSEIERLLDIERQSSASNMSGGRQNGGNLQTVPQGAVHGKTLGSASSGVPEERPVGPPDISNAE